MTNDLQTDTEKFRADVEAFLTHTGIAPTKLGLEAVNNGKFVTQIREGVSPRLTSVDRVRAYMRAWQSPGPFVLPSDQIEVRA
ncbi:MAG: hypothetical protein AAGL24_09920 [Pseudomonadota bacterium]